MFNFGTAAVGMHNGVMARHTVVVFLELPRQLHVVLHLVLGEVLETVLYFDTRVDISS